MQTKSVCEVQLSFEISSKTGEIVGMKARKIDVMIVGAGPAGCAAAKRCAEAGMETVLVEGKRLPRDKVCSGLISGPKAKALVTDEFGPIPEEVLADPFYYSGAMIHVPGAAPCVIEENMPVGWRRDIDYWMTRKAVVAGCEVRDGRRVTGVENKNGQIEIKLSNGEEPDCFTAPYLIGADGARSVVRRIIHPELKASYQQEVRECYAGSFPLERNYFHGFFLPGKFWFDINHKGGHFCLEVSAKPGELKKSLSRAKEILRKEYGFDPEKRAVRRDGCMEPRIHEQLINGAFLPARGNILLAGDAAGFQLPNSMGIGTALLSGFMAAESIIESARQGRSPEGLYIKRTQPIIDVIKTQCVAALNSRYSKESRSAEESASSIRSFFVETMF